MNAVSPIKAEQTPAETGEAKNVMSMIERVASDPQFDVAKLEKLITLQTQILDRQAAQETPFARKKPSAYTI